MSEIKSSYEKALERFKDIAPDRSSLVKSRSKEQGQILCAKKLRGEKVSIKETLDAIDDDEEKKWVKEGIQDTFIAQIALFAGESSFDYIPVLKEIATDITTQDEEVVHMLDQYVQFCHQYIENKSTFMEQMKEQYTHMMQQQGQRANVMDPKFLETSQKKLKDIEEQYKPALQQIKDHLRTLLQSVE